MLSFFSACAKPKMPDLGEEDDNLDFRDAEFVISTGIHTHGVSLKKGISASQDREIDRYYETEKEFNLKFVFENNIEPATHFLAGLISGGIKSDMLYCWDYHLYDAYLINTILPVENIINDPESEKWDVIGDRTAIYGGTRYGIFPNYWETIPQVEGFVHVNMTILEKYNIDDPHEIIEAGEWDWTHFREFLSKTVIKDGDVIWEGMGVNGIGWPTITSITPFMFANGARFITDKNGRLVCDINSPEAKEALEYVASLTADGLFQIGPVDMQSWFFDKGERFMVMNGQGYSTNDTYTICGIRYPYGPSGDTDTVSTVTQGEKVWSFPIFSSYTEEEVGAVAEFLFEPLSDVYPNGWKDVVEDTFFFDRNDFEYFVKGVEEAEYIDAYIITEGANVYDRAINDVIKGYKSADVALDGAIEIIQNDIDEKFNSK